MLATKFREIICIHVGHAGTKIGNEFWEQLCMEHYDELFHSDDQQSNVAPSSFYSHQRNSDTNKERFVPLALFVDLQDEEFNRIQRGGKNHTSLYGDEQFVHQEKGAPISGGSFAVGYVQTRELLEKSMEKIRKMVEQCNYLQCFLVMHSVGGGFGSGFTASLLEALSAQYGKKGKMTFSVYPNLSPYPTGNAPNTVYVKNSCYEHFASVNPLIRNESGGAECMNQSIMESYNCMLATNYLADYADATFVFENDQLYNIFQKRRFHSGFGIKSECNWRNINEPIINVLSCLTCNERSSNTTPISNGYLMDIIGPLNMPYPRIHFFISSLCKTNSFSSIDDVYKNINLHVKCDLNMGGFSYNSLYFRNKNMEFNTREIVGTLRSPITRNIITFMDWSPSSTKCNLNALPLKLRHDTVFSDCEQTTCMIGNSSCIGSLFTRVSFYADKLRDRNSHYLYLVGEGLGSSEYYSASGNVKNLEQDYLEISLRGSDPDFVGENE